MKKVAVVYWSGTGNTEAMANAVLEGAKESGADAAIYSVSEFDASSASSYDALAFGCPAMGAEVLEETEFEPMWEEIKGSLTGKAVVLFGSYGWGDGEWMRTWEEDAKAAGMNLAADSYICNDAPGDDELAECKALGKAVAE